MGIVIGMDEAGYGPNLGPLVVSLTCWEVPGDPRQFDFWTALDDVVAQSPKRGDSRLHVADSKQVYSPAKGLKRLERSVLSAAGLAGISAGSLKALWEAIAVKRESIGEAEPWFEKHDLPLPSEEHSESFDGLVERWKKSCEQSQIRLRTLRSDIVLTERFNQMTRASNKSMALSRISLRLLREVWDPDSSEPVLIVADKHGGRNRYDELLAEILDGRMILRGEEGKERSTYRVGNTEIRFQMQAESHFPVALASMFSKYFRELSMHLFNRFWQAHLPHLKATKGYPVDAKRFRREIAETQTALGIHDDVLWRER